jgi:hypothetical protein
MTLNDFIEQLVHAGPASWHRTIDGGSGSDMFAHHKTAVYRDDVAVTMAWGFDLQTEFKEGWAGSKPAAEARHEYADIFFHGGLVLRVPYIVVKGGILPLPIGAETMTVPGRYYSLVRLIAKLDGHEDYEGFVKQSGMKVVDERWQAID